MHVNTKLASLFMALSLTACATTKQTIITERVDPDDCSILATEQSFTNGEADAPARTYQSNEQPYATRCGGETEEAQRLRFETEQLEFRKSVAFQAMAARVSAVYGTPERESEIEQRFLALVDSQYPETQEEARALMNRYNINERKLRENVARDFIRTQISILAKDGGTPNFAAIATLLDLREQDQLPQERRRFPALDPVFVREEVDTQLNNKNLSAQMLENAYRAGFGRRQSCSTTTNPDGTSRTRCSSTPPKADSGLFILDQSF